MDKEFFSKPTEEVAQRLLGAEIIKDDFRAKIVETEAYLEEDPASHAYPKKTERNQIMYETYGSIYVYVCYGVHNMLNFTTGENSAGGVLIRAAEPLAGIKKMKKNRGVDKKKGLCNGPGKLCEALEISRELNGDEIGGSLKLESKNLSLNYETSTRIGISKAEDRKLRYYVSDNKFVSNR